MKICLKCEGTGKDFFYHPCKICNSNGILDENGFYFVDENNLVLIAYKLGYQTGYNKAKDIAEDEERLRDETDYYF